MTGYWNYIVDVAGSLSTAGIVVRLLFAMVTGVLIGFDRSLKGRGAGIKTHTLVCIGSALVMITSEYLNIKFGDQADLSRMGAQVISGVGFLGVGTIIVTGKNQVKGLTTAAGLWTCACVGLAIGIGFIEGALIALIFIMLTFTFLWKVDIIIHRYAKVFDLYIEFETNKGISVFLQSMHEMNVRIHSMEISKSKIKGEGPNAILNIGIKRPLNGVEVMDYIRNMDCVRYVEEL